MKLVVQIPCLNEEKTLPIVLKSIPKSIKGIDHIEILVIDDGSTDKTIEVAKKHGVTHFVRHAGNMGLARSFHDGVHKALEMGADIVVNTDGDNQYPQERISDLVQPILDSKADIVVADRQTQKIAHFSPFKKFLQKLGSWVVNKAAGTNIPDAASGFRAYSRQSIIRLNIITTFSYCMETIIQAGNKHLAITSIPVTTNKKTRESRLFSSMWQHVFESGSAITRAYLMYKPHIIFINLGIFLLILGAFPFARFIYLEMTRDGGHHIQSLLFGIVLLLAAFLSFVLAIVADVIRTNRILTEESIEQQKIIRFAKKDI